MDPSQHASDSFMSWPHTPRACGPFSRTQADDGEVKNTQDGQGGVPMELTLSSYYSPSLALVQRVTSWACVTGTDLPAGSEGEDRPRPLGPRGPRGHRAMGLIAGEKDTGRHRGHRGPSTQEVLEPS